MIKEVQRHKKCLEDNSASVKLVIEQSLEQKTASLNQRRVELYQRVDSMVSPLLIRYQQDLASLHQYQGSLLSLQQLYTSGKLHGNTDATSLLRDLMVPKVNVAVQRLEFASTGEPELTEPLWAFGRTDQQQERSSITNGEEEDHSYINPYGEQNYINHSWLLRSTSPSEDDFEVVSPCMPKSSSATSSSIEAVSMDEDEPEQIRKMHNPQMCMQDDVKWLLPASCRRTAMDDISLLTADLGEMRTSAPRFGSSKIADWLLLPRESNSVCTKSSVVTTEENFSQWILASRKFKRPAGENFYAAQVRDMFRCYFEHADVATWVAGEKNMA